MKLKLIEQVEKMVKDTIIDCDEETAKELIESKKAVEFKGDVETLIKEEKQLEQEIVKEIKTEIDSEKQKTINVVTRRSMAEKYVMGKSFIELAKQAKSVGFMGKVFEPTAESKAVVGMSEGGSHTGSDIVYTAITEMQGMWAGADLVYNKTAKRTLPAGANSVVIPLDTFTEYAQGSAPIITGVAEGGTKNINAAPTASVTIQPKTVQTIVAVTDELLEDVPYFDNYLRTKLTQKFANAKEQLVLAGTYGAANGFYGVTDGGTSAFYTAITVSNTADPTLAEMLNFEKAIDPMLRPGASWVIGNGLWTSIKATFLTAANLQNQIVDPVGNKLLGYPVMVSANINSIILGNWNEYTVVESRRGEVIDTSIHVYFTTDQTLYRITSKLGGTPTYVKRTAYDSTTVAAFAIKNA